MRKNFKEFLECEEDGEKGFFWDDMNNIKEGHPKSLYLTSIFPFEMVDGTYYNHFSRTKPEPEFVKGQRVLVRDTKKEPWSPAFFKEMKTNRNWPFIVTLMDSCNGWKYCIPYDEETMWKNIEREEG